jgi:hypothetical protein
MSDIIDRSEIERLQVRWEMSDMRCMELKRELAEARACLREAHKMAKAFCPFYDERHERRWAAACGEEEQ